MEKAANNNRQQAAVPLPYAFGDMVKIDGHSAGCVTAYEIRSTNPMMIEVSWLANGDAKKSWVEEWRVSPL